MYYDKFYNKAHIKILDVYKRQVQGIMMDYDTKTLQGGADPRRDGQAAAF